MFLELLPWALFMLFVFAMLALDLGVFHKDAHQVERREALAWSAVWIGLAIAFNIGIYIFRGTEDGLEWTTGYLVEKTLSVDNIFIILLIFSAFAVPQAYQHRVLFWGIVGALVMRAALIAVAGVLLSTLHFVIYIFGAFLIFTGIKFLREQDHQPDLERHPVVRFANRIFRTSHEYDGQKFFTRKNGLLYATPLFVTLLLIEATDLVFAVDSIPAIYAITDDPFIVFTSNIFAILGLRSLYFVLAGYLSGLAYLKPALAAILVFVGAKMLVIDFYKVPSLASLAVIATILTVAIAASLIVARRRAAVLEKAPALAPESGH
ncbi:TerC family protein [Candidatus Amarobacter glycogenicus]|uniref:TerC family protein n=1 Tax=Candidatus Amarobacter glycogenicus TaxID=3140699 RepID=UPI0031CC484E